MPCAGCVRDLDDESELEDLVEDDSMSSIAARGPHASQMQVMYLVLFTGHRNTEKGSPSWFEEVLVAPGEMEAAPTRARAPPDHRRRASSSSCPSSTSGQLRHRPLPRLTLTE